MAESLSELIRSAPDAQKRTICIWCAKRGEWHLPVTEIYKGEALTAYCCSEEHQRACQEALE